MNPQFDSLCALNIGLMRDLGALAVAGSEQFARQQLDSTQFMIERTNRQVKGLISNTAAAKSPVEWSQALQAGAYEAIEVIRDCLVAASDYQAETLRLMQQHATAVETLLTEVFPASQGFGSVSPAKEKRPTKGNDKYQRLAA